MKRLKTIMLVSASWAVSIMFNCHAEEAKIDPVANEKEVIAELKKEFGSDRVLNVEQFKKVVNEISSGQRKNAYILDLRTEQEFYTFHIENSDHIHAGHMYTIPKHIPDVNAEIYLYCRTSHRAFYVAPMLKKYGYNKIWVLDGGILSWVKASYPVVNQYMGRFVAKYENFETDYNPNFKDNNYRVREFHPF
jgi:rhodanese-related sulfurtransferase